MKLKRILASIAFIFTIVLTLSSCDFSVHSDIPKSYDQNGGKLVAHYLDVGQGDSIFIELPNDQTMLIDSGENYHGAAIIEYIKDCGRKKID